MNLDARRIVIIIALVAAVVLLIWALPHGRQTPPEQQTTGELAAGESSDNGEETEAETSSPPPADEPEVVTIPPGPSLIGLNASAEEALAFFQQGQAALAADEIIEARRLLSRALFSGRLGGPQAEQARATLTDLADRTIFSGSIDPDDPYTFGYELKPGDTLGKVEDRLDLWVPVALIMHVNHIEDARRIMAGRTLKLIYGPFHAIVAKRSMTLDLYLRREGLDPVFVRRMPVGLGADNGTPSGMWQVDRGKMSKAPWYPPPRSGLGGKINWGEPNYAFGEKGLWIPLKGLDENTMNKGGYGIHSTNDPDSIGRSESLGCIRLRDDEIELLYTTLYETKSTVRVVD